jgi:argininosuccinate lyase
VTAGTGRLKAGLTPRAARIVFGDNGDAGIDLELPYITEIDEAHLVMLTECGLIGADSAAKLLVEIRSLRHNGFLPLRGRPAPRGTYLLYEDYLIKTLGADVGGVLHTGRSRNDLKATMHHMRMRRLVLTVLAGLLRLQAVLLSRARRHRMTVMPAYSQYQPATPVSYGYYLLGIAESLDRDILGVLQACDGLHRCPLGAASGTGTDIAIDATRTAQLLGFSQPVEHAAYAIASRDTLVRLMSACVMAGLTLSRLAADLQLWSTPEFGMIGFPDSLVGSSSAMPQKRNPFLLEHIKGGSGVLIGAWTSAVTNIKNAPFGNSVEVSTEAVAPIWPGVERLTDVIQLAISVVAGARPCPGAMLRSADEGFTVATAMANQLVGQGLPFRIAHRAIGSLITELLASPDGQTLDSRLDRILAAEGVSQHVHLTDADLDPAAVSAATDFGGGPGPRSFTAAQHRMTGAWRDYVRAVSDWSDRLRIADRDRSRAVENLIGGHHA